MPHRLNPLLLATVAVAGILTAASATGDDLRIAVATSVDDSGLLEKLRAAYQPDCKCTLDAVAAGSGPALEMLRRGDVDAAITHAPDLEKQAVADGAASGRFEFMANDFIVVGPQDDPAGISDEDLAGALAAIARVQVRFISRSDNSGTHRAEIKLWDQIGIEFESTPDWYLQSGLGMARSLLLADELNAYTISDSATFAVLAERRQLHIIQLSESRKQLGNRYSIVTAAAAGKAAGRFALWLQSRQAQQTISQHRLSGTALFTAPAP